MIKRYVKLTFAPDKVEEFLTMFDTVKDKIRAHQGCQYMELLKDVSDPCIYFTLSYWDDVDALETYRHSDLFKDTWTKTKACFGGKPEAWSMVVVDQPAA